MNENEIMAVEDEVNELTTPQGAGMIDGDIDIILYQAERAEKYITAMNKIMNAAIRITTEYDWVLIGGQPYLQESGATKVARMFGVSWTIGKPTIEMDNAGYKTFTYKGRFILKGQFVECEGSRSMKDEFFAGKDNPEKGKSKKTADEIDERDVKMSAYTNCINNGVKRLIPGLRNIKVETLEEAGLNVEEIRGYSFNTGSKGGKSGKAEDSGLTCSVCNAPITQAEASFSEAKYKAKLCRKCQKEQGAKPAPKAEEKPTGDPLYGDESNLPFN